MNMKKTIAHKNSNKQRLSCLKLAFKTIDVFAKQSLSPQLIEKLNDVKQSLIKNYSK